MTIDDLQKVPDCSSVSQLKPLNPDWPDSLSNALSSNTLILVSQKQPDGEFETESQYLSKYATIDELDKHVEQYLDIRSIWDELKKKVDWSALSTYAHLCADTDIPYIISSFYISAGTVVSVDGYELSSGLQIAIDRNGYIPNRLSTRIEYDSDQNLIVLRNFDGTISSSIDRDEVFEDLVRNDLSNVTVSKDGSKVYLHFIIRRSQGAEPELKRVTVNLSTLSPYEFADGFKLNYPGEGLSGKISVVVDYAQVSSAIGISGLLDKISALEKLTTELSGRLSALESRLSSTSLVAYENPIYK